MDRRTLAFVVPALLACTPETSPPAPTPTPTPAVEPNEPAPTPVAEPQPAPTNMPVVQPNVDALRLVAMREGSMALREGWLMIDGEPVEVDPAGRIVRDPTLARGLGPLLQDVSDPITLAFAGDPRGVAFVTTQLDHDRATTRYDVYAHEADAWKRLELAKGLTTEFYPSLFTRGDAILGLRAYAANPDAEGADDESDDNDFLERLRPALANCKPGFVQLAGPSVALPRLPAGVDLASAATSSDGTLYAITQQPPRRSWNEESDPNWRPSVLVWAPGSVEPKILSLPDYGSSDPLSLSIAGDRALIGGQVLANKPYLAVVHDTTIELASADFPSLSQRSGWVTSATRSPAGDLWMSVGDWIMADEKVPQSLWHRPAESTGWLRVELPLPSNEQVGAGTSRWAFSHQERRWYSTTRAGVPASPAEGTAQQVAWFRDALWVVADLGMSLENSAEIGVMDVRRTGLYTTRELADPPVVLPPYDQLIAERLANQPIGKPKPGKADCYRFSIVLPIVVPSVIEGLDESGFGLTLAQIDALEAGAMLDVPDYASLELLYVGEIEGRRELVISAAAGGPELAKALSAKVEEVLGSKPTLDCRPRQLVHVVGELGGS